MKTRRRRAACIMARSLAGLRAPLAVASIILGVATCQAVAQVKESVLYSFSGEADGGIVYAPVIVDTSIRKGAERVLYGATGYGGAYSGGCRGLGCGTVFRLASPPDGRSAWTETVLGSFSGAQDGNVPLGGLLETCGNAACTDKTFYGTTSGIEGGGGTVFKVANGSLTTLWNFTGGSEGSFPPAGVIAGEAVDGTRVLYGTASEGGVGGCGVVYRLAPPGAGQTAWTEQTIWAFQGGSDGCYPGSSLIADRSGRLYGTTGGGDRADYGTVFRLVPPREGKTAWTDQVLWRFSGGADGNAPAAGLIADEAGNLYGTTAVGGASNQGVVFKLAPPRDGTGAWSQQTLWSFSGGSDGGYPYQGLISDSVGALYGTTGYGGGSTKCFPAGGVAFKLTPPVNGRTAWAQTTLWTFSNAAGGCFPQAPLVADAKGALYGTTQYGGSGTSPTCSGVGCGVVFRLTGTGFVPKREDCGPNDP